MDFIENVSRLTIPEIEKFIEENDVHRVFDTRHRWHSNFVKHFEKLIAAGHVATFRKDDRLTGLCSWMLVNNRTKHDINKSTWVMPENFWTGNILYVDVCLLREGTSIFKIKSYLGGKYKSAIDEVFWYDSPNSRFFRSKIKGGVTCPKEQLVAV